ncbi:MAG: hypothetical protein LBH19_08845 [Dysgonamonadaceae bacterium]|jgi:hypothetical protein|nr:hypothetical protein [Dysgonamonadaceae bacterium]
MIRKIFKPPILVLLLAGIIACESETEPEIESEEILPSSIKDVVDVFELKYGEVKEWRYKNQVFKFSITDIEDKLIDCTNPYAYMLYDNSCIHAFIRIETFRTVSIVKITSPSCGGSYYYDEDSDVSQVWNSLEITLREKDIDANFQYIFHHLYGKETGEIFFTKLDTVNRIVSGRFQFQGQCSNAMFEIAGDSIVFITQGRFDIKLDIYDN